MEKEKTKLYQKWWFWLCVVFIVLIVCFIFNYTNDTNIIANVNLNKKVSIGNLTYYINDSWETKESSDNNVQFKYYYPTNDTMLMIQFNDNGNYGNSSSINNFLDGYVSGMNLNSADIIDKTTKSINDINYGVVRCYINNYETIQYIFPNNDEAYTFCFGQKNQLNEKNIDFIESILKKVQIITETKEENQTNDQSSTTQTNNTPDNNQYGVNNSTTNKLTNEKPIETHSQSSKPSTSTNQQKNNNSQTNKPTKQEKPSTSQPKPNETKPTEQVNIQSKYQSVLNEYSTKLKNKTPSLIAEYKNEASKNTNGLNGLATICNNKVSILAGISTEGIGKMANIYHEYGSGKYSEYESWAGKLQDVYMKEAGKIQDVYMNSVM